MKYRRIFVVVADSLGVGEMPDAAQYGDTGANTLKHLSYAKEDFSIPMLYRLGIGYLTDVHNCPPNTNPLASYGKMQELSVGKDTLTGHWEMMGLEVLTPFPSFTDTGFPPELIQELEERSGRKVIGNTSASGTEIMKDLGEEHMRTGALIVYTSADSVLQIAAHEEIVPIPELYHICEIAREITLNNPSWTVGRIIARPFIGTNKDDFARTPNRHDYAVKPFARTVLNELKDAKLDVIAIGKIRDIFEGEGITAFQKTKSNEDGMNKTIEIAKGDFKGLCFVNLVDFDAVYGHRRDAYGYATSVEAFDHQLKELVGLMRSDDLLIVTADHGNDPTHSGTDHTREYTPILVYNPLQPAKNLGIRGSFADIGVSIAHNFGVKPAKIGSSLFDKGE
ncbi:MAG: phosphopentomutase [Bacilli bacterium]|nr:phosphopentomutase [Bacilli bacterium]